MKTSPSRRSLASLPSSVTARPTTGQKDLDYNQLAADKELTANRLVRAEKLVGGLGKEGVRWKATADDLLDDNKTVVLDDLNESAPQPDEASTASAVTAKDFDGMNRGVVPLRAAPLCV